jgi:hypothetical protein
MNRECAFSDSDITSPCFGIPIEKTDCFGLLGLFFLKKKSMMLSDFCLTAFTKSYHWMKNRFTLHLGWVAGRIHYTKPRPFSFNDTHLPSPITKWSSTSTDTMSLRDSVLPSKQSHFSEEIASQKALATTY